ncbi:MAG TPA: hypothetical protein VLV56_11525 [Burkholderiales bacterium]|nr:hypothetical protein [Burkholderiales bacterium]
MQLRAPNDEICAGLEDLILDQAEDYAPSILLISTLASLFSVGGFIATTA